MTLVIGTDEAGYGPNLGPLVVAATAWQVDAPPDAAWSTIAAAVALACRAEGMTGLPWGDSKRIYKGHSRGHSRGGSGLHDLEAGVMAALGIVAGATPRHWDALQRMVGPLGPATAAERSPQWDGLSGLRMPVEADPEACLGVAGRLAASMAARGVRLVAVRAAGVYPAAFNELLDRGLNKSDILSRATLSLAKELADAFPVGPIVIWCDRHGGRKRYAGVVTHAFAGAIVQPAQETATCSTYRIDKSTWIEFSVGGEARTPVAVASMTAKYVRERAMECFNAFWCERQEGLAATAGYPLDAKRWREDAADTIRSSGVPEDRLWRRV